MHTWILLSSSSFNFPPSLPFIQDGFNFPPCPLINKWSAPVTNICELCPVSQVSRLTCLRSQATSSKFYSQMSVISSKLDCIICGEQTLQQNNPQKSTTSTMTYYNLIPGLIFFTWRIRNREKCLSFILKQASL